MTPTPQQHFRAPDADWAKAQQRAAREGTTLSAVLREFLTAYAAGKITRTWTPTDKDE